MNNEVLNFFNKNNIEAVIAISGGADENKEKVNRILEDSMVYYSKYPIAILTGGTKWGIPNYASELAKDYNIKTIGVMPQRGEKYSLNSLDLKLVSGTEYGISEYGDESSIFAKIADGVEIIGGSAGTGVEFFHVMKINDRIKKYLSEDKTKEKIKPVAPVVGVGGFAEEIYKLEVAKKNPEAIPFDKIYEGGDAAKYILNKLDFY